MAPTEPKRGDFKSQELYEEALGFWRSRQRGVRPMALSKDSPVKSETSSPALLKKPEK